MSDDEAIGREHSSLVVGASGATGRLLAGELLDRGHRVKMIVRSRDGLPDSVRHHPRASVIQSSLLDLGHDELVRHVEGCGAVASCLGHAMSWKGLFGHPRRLVTDATARLCHAIRRSRPRGATKFVLMNTAGNSNRDLVEPRSFAEKCVVGLLRLVLPPHIDNEEAADYLRTSIGPNDATIEWTVVRPDTLNNEEGGAGYEVFPSPTRSAIFNAGKTSRANVARFMAELITDTEAWSRWKGKMPVIYNKGSS